MIHDEWGKAATTWAINRLPEGKYPASLLISGWVHVLGRVPSWMTELAQEHPELVTSTLLPPATRWRLHAASPTVAGWHHLAGVRGTPTTIEPALFRHTADVAVQTLEQALGESTDDAKRLVLRRWLYELTGVTP